MRMETVRLILRPWEEADAQALYRYAKDERVGPQAGWAPHPSVEYSREIIRTVLSQPETYAVVLKRTGEPVGSVGLMFPPGGSAPMQEGEAEIGYWLGAPHWGQGLIPEAVFRLQRRCFAELGCRAVWATYFAGNERSRRVMEKCGFRHQCAGVGADMLGAMRTEHYTRLTREEYWQSMEG